MRKQRGFSLIELLIVIAIILIIAAIAVPSLLRSRMLANESAAASTVRDIDTAQATYMSTYQGYATAIANLGSPGACAPGSATSTAACLVDPLITGGIKQGYDFASAGSLAVGGKFQEFVTSGVPGSTVAGKRSFCGSSDMVIHFDAAGALAATPSACQAQSALQN